MAYAFNELISGESQQESAAKDDELRSLSRRERSALRSAIGEYQDWLNSLAPSDGQRIWPEFRSSFAGEFGAQTFRAEITLFNHDLDALALRTLAIDVANDAFMTFESASGNLFFAAAGRMRGQRIEAGWQLYDSSRSGRSVFGLFRRPSPAVGVQCVPGSGCRAVLGD